MPRTRWYRSLTLKVILSVVLTAVVVLLHRRELDVLSVGDVYDMKARRIEKLGTGATPPRRRTDGTGTE